MGFCGGSVVNNLPANAGDLGSIPGSDPWVGKIPWRRAWQPTPVFLPGKFHGQRNLVDYSPQGRKELTTTKQLRRKWQPTPVFLPREFHGQRSLVGCCP